MQRPQSINDTLSGHLNETIAHGNYREFVTINRRNGRYPLADCDGQEVAVWCSNDYLGMSQHPRVLNAMHAAIDNFGAGSGGSRNIGGTYAHYTELEKSLAEWFNKDRALVFPTGFSSNDSTIQTLLRVTPNAIVLSDEKNHASIINGIRSGRAAKAIFRHNDVDHLRQILSETPGDQPKIITFESIYSMDGDIAPVEKIVEIAQEFGALIFLDEVHAVGMYGPQGAGIAAQNGIIDHVDIIQATMAKSIGVIGGFIAGNDVLIDSIRSFAPGFIFTTSLPPAVSAGCLASVEHLRRCDYERAILHAKTSILRAELDFAGIPIAPASETHILPVMVGDANKCKRAAQRLLENHAIYLQPINPPTVPTGTERFRVNITPNHTENQIAELVRGLCDVFDEFDIPRDHTKEFTA